MMDRSPRPHARPRETGQILVISALLMTVLIGFVSLSIDVGRMMITRRQLQNGVDAAAHAGVQVLPGHRSDASNAATDWASRNSVTASEITIGFSNTYTTDDTITVRAQRTMPFMLARVLGLSAPTIGASAVATVASIAGGAGVMPFGLVDLDTSSPGFGYTFGQSYNIKQVQSNKGFNSPGNYGPVTLDASGGKTMRDIIGQGGSQTLYHVGDQIPTLTGQQTGNLNQGFDAWAASHNDAMGSSCDNWNQSHTYVNNKLEVTAQCRYRVVLVPIIDSWPNGNSQNVTILGFAQLYVTGYNNNTSSISGIFLDDSYAHPNIVLGAYDTYGTRIAKISQ